MLNLYLITTNKEFIDFISNKFDIKLALESLLKGEKTVLQAIEFSEKNNTEAILEYLKSDINYDETDQVIVMIDEGQYGKFNFLKETFLTCKLSNLNNLPYKSYHNYSCKEIKKSLKKIRLLKSIIDDGSLGEMARLPLRNFDNEIFRNFIHEASSRYNSAFLDNDFQKLASQLKSMRKPKKRSAHKNKYYIDDQNRHYQLGMERHSKHETGGEHTIVCDFRAKFRFGCKIDKERHFNVSAGDSDNSKLNTTFKHCHGSNEITVKGATHVNMFSNDFIA
ncbi:hypothetical protein RB981_002729 [Vibrio cholerae]|nr:hypothetical protein [Vibrio cholerae]